MHKLISFFAMTLTLAACTVTNKDPVPGTGTTGTPTDPGATDHCTVGGCHQTCTAGATCDLDCSGGHCTQSCPAGATCTFSCSGAGCTQECVGPACTLSCSGGGCQQSCSGSCTKSCTGAGCS